MSDLQDLTAAINGAIDDYRALYECDVNDVLSVLSLILVIKCRGLDIPRTEMLRNVSMIWEMTEPGAVN